MTIKEKLKEIGVSFFWTFLASFLVVILANVEALSVEYMTNGGIGALILSASRSALKEGLPFLITEIKKFIKK